MDSNDVNIDDWETNSMEEDFDEEGDQYVEGESKDTEKGKNVVVTKRGPNRKLRSKVWSVFIKLPRSKDGKLRSKCKLCNKIYICESNYGTGNMKRHMDFTCPMRKNQDISQMLINKAGVDGVTLTKPKDPEVFRGMISAAIVCHDLPFQFVEWVWIRKIIEYLDKDFILVSRNTAKADVLKMYAKEKQKIRNMLEESPDRISLTCDLWTSIATDGYLCVTSHFLDKDWVLQKKVLNFSFMAPPHDGVSLSHKINTLLCEWGIQNRIFSITLDNASSNKSFIDILKNQLNIKGALVCHGDFLHIRCCAHILNLIVQDGLKEIDEEIHKIRECVKYVKGSQVRKQKFLECAKQVSLDCKMGLRQDVPTRWNSTYLMLESAINYRRALCTLELSDGNFKHCPSSSEWEKVEKIALFLKVFYDVTCIFSGTKYPTSNLYFPKVLKIYVLLQQKLESDDLFLRNMATQLYTKFNKYWGDFCVIMAIALILDPRYKMKFVDFAYRKVYGEDSFEFETVQSKLNLLFDEYVKNASTTSTSNPSGRAYNLINNSSSQATSDCLMEEWKSFAKDTSDSDFTKKTQLQLYLDEPYLEDTLDFDVLSFWKANAIRFPELAMMARDVLSIPVSTVASESAFGVGGRVLDQYRSSLKPHVVEAIVCTRDWIYGDKENSNLGLDELTEDVMNMNDDTETVGASNHTIESISSQIAM